MVAGFGEWLRKIRRGSTVERSGKGYTGRHDERW